MSVAFVVIGVVLCLAGVLVLGDWRGVAQRMATYGRRQAEQDGYRRSVWTIGQARVFGVGLIAVGAGWVYFGIN